MRFKIKPVENLAECRTAERRTNQVIHRLAFVFAEIFPRYASERSAQKRLHKRKAVCAPRTEIKRALIRMSQLVHHKSVLIPHPLMRKVVINSIAVNFRIFSLHYKMIEREKRGIACKNASTGKKPVFNSGFP